MTPGKTLACAALVVASPGVLHAEEARLTATLQVAPGELPSCVEASRLRGDVEKRLERTVFVPEDRADVTVSIRGEPDGAGGTVVRVELVHEGTVVGSRSLEGKTTDCSRFRDKLALVVGMLLDVPADEVLPPSPLAEEPAAAPVPPPPAPADEAPAPRGPASRTRPWATAEVAALATASVGTLPRLGAGATLAVTVVPRGFVGIRGTLGVERGATVVHEGGTLDVSAVSTSAGIVPFVLTVSQRATVTAWASATLTGLFADPQGFDLHHAGAQWVAGASLGAGFRWRLNGGLSAAAEAVVFAPFRDLELTLREADGDTTTLHRISPVGAGLSLGVAWAGT